MGFYVIQGLMVKLPIRFKEGDVLTEYTASILNQIQLGRIRAKLNEMIKKREISPEELQNKANELINLPLKPYSSYDDKFEEDPIVTEALLIAKQLIENQLLEEGSMIPKNLNQHAQALIDAMPEIITKAEKRVEARFLAAQSALSNLN